MTHFGNTRILLGPRSTLLIALDGAEMPQSASADGLADAVFRHDPPTPAEMEQAIDIVEDALMATPLRHAERGKLVTADPLLRNLPGLSHEGARLTRDEVEALFQ